MDLMMLVSLITVSVQNWGWRRVCPLHDRVILYNMSPLRSTKFLTTLKKTVTFLPQLKMDFSCDIKAFCFCFLVDLRTTADSTGSVLCS